MHTLFTLQPRSFVCFAMVLLCLFLVLHFTRFVHSICFGVPVLFIHSLIFAIVALFRLLLGYTWNFCHTVVAYSRRFSFITCFVLCLCMCYFVTTLSLSVNSQSLLCRSNSQTSKLSLVHCVCGRGWMSSERQEWILSSEKSKKNKTK